VGNAAEILALVISVVAIVIVVAVALGVPGLNLAAAALLFNIAQGLSAFALATKAIRKFFMDDDEVGWGTLIRDTALLAVSFGGGAWAKAQTSSVTAFSASFTRATTTVQRVGTAYRLTQLSSSRFLLRTASISSGSVRVFHVSIAGRFAQPLSIQALWNVGFGLGSDIPVFLWDRGVGDVVTKALTTPLPIVFGGSQGCTAVHARIAA
jgi:hypothetical protein